MLTTIIHFFRSLDGTVQGVIIAAIIRAAEEGYRRFLTRGDRVAAEEAAIWKNASEWREEQRNEIMALREEVRQLRDEVVALRQENERARDLMCASARECENRERVS